MRAITISDAIQAWVEYRQEDLNKMSHLEKARLEQIIENVEEASDIEIDHLILCKTCYQKIFPEFEGKESVEFWETAWRKAAAAKEVHWPQKLYSKNGTYKIEIRESETHKNKGIIVVKIDEKKQDKLEGKKIAVIDGKGREILQGIVKEGQVFQRIANLNTLDLKLLVKVIE